MKYLRQSLYENNDLTKGYINNKYNKYLFLHGGKYIYIPDDVDDLLDKDTDNSKPVSNEEMKYIVIEQAALHKYQDEANKNNLGCFFSMSLYLISIIMIILILIDRYIKIEAITY